MNNKQTGTKNIIIEKATKLFSEQGFHATSIKDICNSAQTNICSVNYHFKTKEGLFEAIIEQFLQEKVSPIFKIIETHAETLAEFKIKLTLLLEAFFNLAEENCSALIIIFRDIAYLKESNKEKSFKYFDSLIKKLSSFIEYSRKKKQIDNKIKPYTITEMIMFIIDGKMRKSYFYQEKIDKKQYINSTINLLIDGITPKNQEVKI